MGVRIPEYFADQLKKMHNVIYVVDEYKQGNCLDDQVLAYGVPDDVSRFLSQCSACGHPDPVVVQGGKLFVVPAGTVALIDDFKILSDHEIAVMREHDIELFIYVQNYCL